MEKENILPIFVGQKACEQSLATKEKLNMLTSDHLFLRFQMGKKM
jgi:hypothetical protein